MKAYRGADGKIRLFRPDQNMKRLLRGAKRAMLPTFQPEQMIECLKRLVKLEQEWIPHSETSSLYIRPTFIGTDPSLGVALSNNAQLFVILCPVGPYFATGFKPVSLYADPKFVRAWPGGCGDQKLGSNYGPTVFVQRIAEANGQQQVLWLYGEEHQATEVGTMNIFFVVQHRNGRKLNRGGTAPALTTPKTSNSFKLVSSNKFLAHVVREGSDHAVAEWPHSARDH